MISRRGFLGLLGGMGLAAAGCGTLTAETAGEGLTSALPLPDAFTGAAARPPVARPVGTDPAGADLDR